jgi:hypothetical protein
MLALETEIGTLNRKLGDYEKTLSQIQTERRQMAQAKNALNEKYNILRRNALQLEAFRKQIVSMVEFSPNAINIPDGEASFVEITAGMKDFEGTNMNRPPLFDQDLNSFMTETFVRNTAHAADQVASQLAHMDKGMETLHLTPFMADTGASEVRPYP